MPLGNVETVTLTWLSGGVPQQNKPVTFATTRGLLDPNGTPAISKPAVTDANGKASITISSTTSGPAKVTASGAGVNTELPLNFVATNPTKISVQASPSTIPTHGTDHDHRDRA